MPLIFSIKEAMSNTPEVLGEIEWASRIGTDVILEPNENPSKTTLKSTIAHNFAEGAFIYLQGVGFGKDGFYKVSNLTETSFVIDLVFTSHKQVKVYGIETYSVFYVDKLSVRDAAEFKKLRDVDRLALQMRQAELAAKSTAAAKLIEEFNIDISTGKVDESAVKKLLTESPVQFLEKIQKVDLSAIIDMQAFKVESEQALNAIQRRELEILCQMPLGHMNLMDNLPGIQDSIDKIYTEVAQRTEEATKQKARSGSGQSEAEPKVEEEKKPKSKASKTPKSSTSDTLEQSSTLSQSLQNTVDAKTLTTF